MRALPIGEARRRLPELVRRVAAGHRTVAIGRGGRAEVMLVPAASQALDLERRPLKGLIEIVGTVEDLQAGQRQLRRDVDASLTRTARLVVRPVRKRRT